jgi:hypothetical protein
MKTTVAAAAPDNPGAAATAPALAVPHPGI